MKILKALLITGIISALIIGVLVMYARSLPQATTPTPTPTPVTPAPAPTPTPAPTPVPTVSTKSFTSSKDAFTVEYPESITPTEDKQDMELSGYIPVCDPDVAVACFPLGKTAYAGKNFENAAFAVHLRPKLKTDVTCNAVTADVGETADGGATIGGVAFRKFAFGDAAMGKQLSGERYRTFRDGKCYELVTDTLTSTFENYPEGTIERFTDQDRADVQRMLDTMLMSFRFK